MRFQGLYKKNFYKFNLVLKDNHKVEKINQVNIAVRVAVKTSYGMEVGTVNLFRIEEMSIKQIEGKIQMGIENLRFWKEKRYAFLGKDWYQKYGKRYLGSFEENLSNFPIFTSDIPFSVSNIGSIGYEEGMSALTPINSGDICLGKVRKVPHWDDFLQQYVPRAEMTVWFSLDHRIFNPHDFYLPEFKDYFKSLNFKGGTDKDIFSFQTDYINEFKLLTEKNKIKMLKILSMNTF